MIFSQRNMYQMRVLDGSNGGVRAMAEKLKIKNEISIERSTTGEHCKIELRSTEEDLDKVVGTAKKLFKEVKNDVAE
jgi:hypothetical protein